jgi:hypothetical protein
MKRALIGFLGGCMLALIVVAAWLGAGSLMG